MSNLTGQSFGRYHIREQLGEGGMATVYKAHDTRLETDVAVKVIRIDVLPHNAIERTLKRFEREAKSLAKLTHPNIVPVMDYGEYEGRPYLVMKYLPGGTLKQLYGGKPISWQQAVRQLIPIAGALDYAHHLDIIHRDVKPANILITSDGLPMLSDFGIAKIIEMEDGQTLTGTGVGIGTPEYMAPEQGMGSGVDGRADIYSLGIVFYELITGRKPYMADTPMAVIFKHVHDPLPRARQYIPDLKESVERVLLKALAKNPKDRYPDAGTFAKAMENLTRGNQTPIINRVTTSGRESETYETNSTNAQAITKDTLKTVLQSLPRADTTQDIAYKRTTSIKYDPLQQPTPITNKAILLGLGQFSLIVICVIAISFLIKSLLSPPVVIPSSLPSSILTEVTSSSKLPGSILPPLSTSVSPSVFVAETSTEIPTYTPYPTLTQLPTYTPYPLQVPTTQIPEVLIIPTTIRPTDTPTYTPIPPPSSPSLISPANNYTGVASGTTFSWNNISNALDYLVEYTGASAGNSGWISSTSFSINTLPAGSYTWHVKARNIGGESSWSETWTTTFQMAPADIIITPRNYSFGWSTSGQNIQGNNKVYCSTNPDVTRVLYWRTNDSGGWVDWIPNIPISGNYDIFVYLPDYTHSANITTQAVYYLNGSSQMGSVVDQNQNKCAWNFLGKYYLNAGTGNYVHMPTGTSENPYRLISADGMMFRWAP